MWVAALLLTVTLAGGKVSLTATNAPLPEAMKALATQLGSRLEMEGELSDLALTLRLENEEPLRALRLMVEGWPVDYYVRGRGEVIILHRRGSAGPKVVFEPPSSAAKEMEQAVEFISRFGLTPEEAKKLREVLAREW